MSNKRRSLHRSLAVFGVAFLATGCSSTASRLVSYSGLSTPINNVVSNQVTPKQGDLSTQAVQLTSGIDESNHSRDTSHLIRAVEDTIRRTTAQDGDQPLRHNQVDLNQFVDTQETDSPILAAPFGSPLPRDANTFPDAFRDLTETEMLTLAMVNSPVLRPLGLRVLENPQGATTIYDSAIEATDPFFGPQAALAEFDTALSASVNTQNNDRVFNNTTLGGDIQELVQDLVSINAGASRRTRSGALLELTGITGYDDNNRAGNIFPNYWETQMEAGVRQPLLRGAGRRFNEIAGPNAQPGFNFSNGIIIARLNNKISDADFEVQVRSFVRDLYSAYWELSRQYRAYASVVDARELAHETWQIILAKRNANVAGGESHREAQARARYYDFRRQALVALGGQGGLYVAERRLRQLMGVQIVDGELLRPIDPPVDVKFVFDYDRLISRAMVDRTEIRQQDLRIQQQKLRLIAANNFMLPQLDLIGRYRLRGFGDDLTGNGARFSSATQDFGSLDHQEWEFGMEMGVTHGRRQARAAVRNATLQLSRERLILAEQQRSLQHEISNAYAEVSSSFATMESSREQVSASRSRLKSSQALYKADKIQLEFMLDAQAELLTAEQQLASDQSRYAVSLIAINAATGSLLSDLGVLIHHSGCKTNVIYLQEVEPTGN